MKITLRLFIFFVLLSCTPEVDTNEKVSYHDNGKVASKYFLLDGKREGLYQEFYPSGKIQIERTYHADSILSQKITDINGKILVNYVRRDGRYYGLLGSSSCISVFPNE